MNPDNLIFIRNLKIVRSARIMTAAELSERSDLRQLKRISDIEDGRGAPTLEEVKSICKVLDCSIDDMLYKHALPVIKFV